MICNKLIIIEFQRKKRKQIVAVNLATNTLLDAAVAAYIVF